MTSTRLARGTKGRVLLYLCAIIVVSGIIALYHTTQTQLEDVRKSNDMCHQQQESLSTQLQVIFDYKQRLEKSLQTEKAEHQQTKSELEAKINEEKSRRNKTSVEANLRFISLQQNYKLLQSQHDDFKEDCSRSKRQQLDENNNLQAKYKEVREQLKKSTSDKDSKLEHLKTQYMQLQIANEKLQNDAKDTGGNMANSENEIHRLSKDNFQLQSELNRLKEKYHIPSSKHDRNVSPAHDRVTTSKFASSTVSFTKQVAIGDNVYQVRDNNDKPPVRMVQEANQLDSPKDMPNQNQLPAQQEYKNSANVLAMPNIEKFKSSTVKTTTRAGFKVSKPSLDGAQPLLLPNVATSSARTKFSSRKARIAKANDNSRNVLPAPNFAAAKKKLPDGVVPVPKLQANVEEPTFKTDDKNIPDDVNDALPNRYRNNIIDSELTHGGSKPKEVLNVEKLPPQNQLEFNLGVDFNQENSAAEVVDPAKAQDDPFPMMDTNMIDPDIKRRSNIKEHKNIHLLHHPEGVRKFKKQHIDDLRLGETKLNGGETLGGGGYNDEPDYDKDVQRGEEMQLEEAEAEGGEDDDPDDYEGHIGVRQKEPAVRN